MSAVEEILKNWDTPETKALREKYIEKFIAKQEEDERISKELVSNTNYIEWLIKFTQDKKGFYDDEWLYFPEELKETDRKNVDKLHLFFQGIDNYAKANHIYPQPGDCSGLYKIRFNETGFAIGILVGQGTVFFCNKVDVEDEKEFIDFNDIMNNKKQTSVNKINEILNNLSDVIESAYENGVPIQAIVNTCNNTIEEISSRKEDKFKSLRLTRKDNNKK